MYRKVLWFYIVLLTLLDVSLNSKLTAHGKNHDDSLLHEPLIDGYHIQEGGDVAGDDEGGGWVRVEPSALRFGRRAVGAPHTRTVTLTNTANDTLHLYSVSAKSPHFYASFFETKVVEGGANTTLSVVLAAGREGALRARLALHTSRGTLRYAVSALAEPSLWEVWPLQLRVPRNATLTHTLTLRNPTPEPVQVLEVYSSAPWLGLELPAPAASLPQRAWRVPPYATRPIVRLRIALPPPSPHDSDAERTFVAFIRIRTNATGGAGGAGADGSLLVPVDATAAPSGPYALPPHVRLRARGSGDPADTFQILVGNSGEAAAPAEAGVWGARCEPADAVSQPLPPVAVNGESTNGAGAARRLADSGVRAVPLRADIPPDSEPLPAANLTLHYAEMWSVYAAEGGAGGGGGEPAVCSGWVRAAGALLPYTVRLYPGTIVFDPPEIHFVTAESASAEVSAGRTAEVRVRNTFAAAVQLERLEPAAAARPHLVVERRAPATLPPGGAAPLCLLRLRAAAAPLTLDTHLTLHTNVSQYRLRVLVYEGTLRLEWEWPEWEEGALRVGVVGTSQTVRVGGRLVNPAPAAVCVRELRALLPAARLVLLPCAEHMAPPPDHPCWCVPGGGSAGVQLVAVAAGREGGAAGAVEARTAHGTARAHVTMHAHAGRLHVPHVTLPPAAPYAWSESEVVVNSSMALRMRLRNVTARPPHPHPAVLHFIGSETEIVEGARAAGVLQHRPERACEPRCYTGLPPHSPEGAAWAANLTSAAAAVLAGEATETAARAALLAALPAETSVALAVSTSRVLHVRAAATLRLQWPRLVSGGAPPGWAGQAAVGGALPLRLCVANPSRSHALVVRAALAPRLALPDVALTELAACRRERCAYSASAFAVTGWRALRGDVAVWGEPAVWEGGPPALLLPPAAEVELDVTFAPREPAALTAYLYLRNNLTVMEGVQLGGRGVFPSFELGGRRPGAEERPILIEVNECGASGEGGARYTLVARNTGSVAVRLREWRVAGRPCAARGFALHPCAPLLLAPNESRALTLAFSPDWTVTRAAAALELRSDLGAHRLPLRARAAAPLVRRCAARLPRPPRERPLRGAAIVVLLVVLAAVLAAGALDAERVLRRARAARHAAGVRAPLDLRSLAHQPPAPPPPPRAPPPPPRRRRARRLDPLAESRAFERWRAALRRTDDDDRSSEDADVREDGESPPHTADATPRAAPEADVDSEDGDPETVEDDGAPDDRGVDEDGASTGSTSSTPPEPNDDDADSEEHASGGDDVRRDSPVLRDRSGPSPAEDALRTCGPIDEVHPRRPRRGDGDGPRRCERKHVDGDPAPRRAATAKPHGRREKPPKRRSAAPATPVRGSPPVLPASPPPLAAVSSGVRLGATWSSVVARSGAPPPPQPLPPIGSDVRRRPEPPSPPARVPLADDSLFYFNGAPERAPATPTVARGEAEFGWHAGGEYAPARGLFGRAPEEDAFGSVGAVGSVWGGGLGARAGWGWPPAPQPVPVRPPPGFAAESAPRPVRPYDPFQSLASIWARGALDWARPDRADAADADDP